MSGPSPRVRLSLQLTEPEIRKLRSRAATQGRTVASCVALLVALNLGRKPKHYRPMPARSARRCFMLNMPLKKLTRAAFEERAAVEGRSLLAYVTGLVVASLAR
jgi:hypothetical protein